jgi:hypothetical protein
LSCSLFHAGKPKYVVYTHLFLRAEHLGTGRAFSHNFSKIRCEMIDHACDYHLYKSLGIPTEAAYDWTGSHAGERYCVSAARFRW